MSQVPYPTPPLPQPTPASPVPVLNYSGVVVPQRPAFNARQVFTWKADRLYRVYLTDTHAFFIWIAGSKQRSAAVGAQFGLVGALIAYFLQKRQQKKAAEKISSFEDLPLDQLLASHKDNYVAPLADFTDVKFEARSFWGAKAANVGRMSFRLPNEKKPLSFLFDTVDDMRGALDRLPPLMTAPPQINVEWNERKKKFTKKK